jgi:hypothetical protein
MKKKLLAVSWAYAVTLNGGGTRIELHRRKRDAVRERGYDRIAGLRRVGPVVKVTVPL